MNDKKTVVVAGVALLVLLVITYVLASMGKEWTGVDESVVEKFAEEAGHPPRDPFINTDQGDLLLFVFLCAGAIGGFVLGYYYRVLFVEHPPEGVAAAGGNPDDG